MANIVYPTLSDVDADRVRVLKEKKAATGLQTAEKEELKTLLENARRVV